MPYSPGSQDLPGETDKSNPLKSAQDSDHKRHNDGCRTLRSLFAASSASVGDLRSLDVCKEVGHGTSPSGVFDICKNGEASKCVDSCFIERPTGSFNEKSISHWRKVVRQWKDKSVKRLSSYPKRNGRKGKGEEDTSHDDDLDYSINDCISNFKSSWKIFSLSELNVATNCFNEENLIGRGGFAEVYKGCLPDGQLVAVKRLLRGNQEEQNSNFLSELGIIVHLDHPNTAKLVGYGIEGGVHLVLQLSTLGSLGSLLRGSRENLDWATRCKIALGITEGLVYLHENCQKRIIHRDIKSDNILLAENYEPQICDFGLALWLPRQQANYTAMKQEGTFGYIAPEYLMQGLVNEKTDVFAFGVVLLELITGRRALDDSNKSILIWAKPLMHKSKLQSLVDPILGDNYNKEEFERMVLIAALCVDASQFVMTHLRGDEYAQTIGMPHLKRTFSEEFLYAKEYNSTKYLNELRRHMQVAYDSNSDISTISPRTPEPQSPPAVF
ncbi:hypothetical protein V2J09_001099 [Rumex salicifolius]